MPANLGGRPTKKNPERLAIVKRALSLGFSNRDAARAAGIGLSTLDEWMKEPKFLAEIESEIMLRRMARVERIEKMAPGWQALAWLQERSSVYEGDIRWLAPDLQIKCRLFEANQQPPAAKPVADPDAKGRLDEEMRKRFKLPPQATNGEAKP
jgi:hypothetical protein